MVILTWSRSTVFRYDAQPYGEVTLVESDSADFRVQIRTKPYGASPFVSVIVGIAVPHRY